jgi:integrase
VSRRSSLGRRWYRVKLPQGSEVVGDPAIKAAELPLHYTPHCLRHTFASLLLQQSVSPAYVQRQCGHASIQLTYGKWLPMGNEAAVDALDSPSDSKVVANASQADAGDEKTQGNLRATAGVEPATY